MIKWITSTDHKIIGQLYPITSFAYFLLAGLMALVIRAELAEPGMQLVSTPSTTSSSRCTERSCCSLFATPLFVGFGNVIMPLQIGAPDVAFPRLNMFSYWLFFFGGITAAAGFLTPVVPRTSAGSPTRRFTTKCSPRAQVRTCGCSAWRWVVWEPSSAP